MPDRPLPSDIREARTPFNDNYVILGIVFVCVLMALVLFGAGMIDERSTVQPNAPVTTQSDTQAPAVTQPSSQAPATTQPDSQVPAVTQPSTQAPVTPQSDSQAPAITQPSTEAPATGQDTP